MAGERLEFLSLIAGGLHYNLSTDKVLSVAVPDVRNLKAPDVRVRATALRLGVYYRMDAQVGSAKSIEWPLRSVVAPAQLQSNDIGVLGWVDRGGTRIYVPVSVFSTPKPTAPHAPADALFRSNVDIESVRWRVWPAAQHAHPPSWNTLDGPIPAGQAFKLPVEKSPQVEHSPQLQRIEIAATIANSDEMVTELFRVFVP